MVERFLFSARVRQFFTAFSRLGTASLLFHAGLWTWTTCLHGRWDPEPLIAAGGRERNTLEPTAVGGHTIINRAGSLRP